MIRFIAQLPTPLPPPMDFPLKDWLNLQAKQDKKAEDFKREFETIRNFCANKQTPLSVTDPKTQNKFVVYRSEISFSEAAAKQERYRVEIKSKNENGEYVLRSTVIYELFPNNENKLDNNNYEVVKTYFEEAGGKDSYTGLPFVTDPNMKTINVKNGKASVIDAEQMEKAEDADIDAGYPIKTEEPEGAKAVKKRKRKRAKRAVRKTVKRKKSGGMDLLRFKGDKMVRYKGFPMRSSIAKKFQEIEKALDKEGYKIQLCSTTGGKHLSWQHPAGYAMDVVIYKEKEVLNPVTKKTQTKKIYITKKEEITVNGKKMNLSVYLESVMNGAGTGLWVYNEYTHGSKYKTGDHFHIAMVNFKELEANLKEAAKEQKAEGAKDISSPGARAKEIVYNALVLNGYNPAEVPDEVKEKMTDRAMKELSR